jgi:hypothetical protein
MLRQAITSNQRDPEAVRSFVIRALLMQQLFARFPAITELLSGLRYRVEVRRSPQFGELPIVTVSAPFSTARPPDHLVTVASGLAGGGSFAEIIDLASVKELRDPVREEVIRVLHEHGQEL